jgi:hypothetical protein
MQSFKRHLVLIPATILLGIAIVFFLSWRSYKTGDIDFRRVYSNIELKNPDSLLNEGIESLAGMTNSRLFFQKKNPSQILSTSYRLKDFDTFNLNIPLLPKMTSSVFTFVDSPYVQVLAGRLSLAFLASLKDDSVKSYKLPATLFTRAAKLSDTSFFLRAVDTSIQKMDQLFMVNNVSGARIIEQSVSQLNKDGGISTDGMLNYDKTSGYLVYVHFYSSEFIVMDAAARLVYRGNTIGPSESAQILTRLNGSSMTSVTPKKFINISSAVWNGHLYIGSAAKSLSDSDDSFTKNTVIDLYELKTGEYKMSFKLPQPGKEKAYKFYVLQDKLIVFYKSRILSYDLKL